MFTVYPATNDYEVRTYEVLSVAIAYANTCGRYTSVWDDENDWEEFRVW